MADAVQAILGNPPPVSNPLAIISGWQDYANKLAQNQQIKAATANIQQNTQTNQQALQSTMAQRHAQIAQGFANMSDAELQGGAPLYTGLDQELQSGQINQQAFNVMKQQLDTITQQSGGAGAAYRPLITQLLKTNLTAPQYIAASTPTVTDTNIGGQQVVRTTPSALALMQNPNGGIVTSPGGINRTLSPGYENAGDQLVPVGGAAGSPNIGLGTTPGQANALETIIDPVTNLPIQGRASQQGGLLRSTVGGAPGGASGPATAAAPPGGYRLPQAAVQVPQQGGTGPQGLLSHGTVAVNPQATQAQADAYRDFADSRSSQPLLKTNEQTLLRVQNELQATPSGPGTNALQNLRNYVSSINGVTGGKLNGNDILAGNYDELGKDLNQLIAQQGGGAKFAGNVDAIIHGNPNLMMNRLANSNVTSIMLGMNRQKQLEYMLTKDQNTGRDFQTARQTAANTDPRALALDAMTPQMRNDVLEELQKSPEAYKKFFATIALAKRAGMPLAAAQAPQQ